MTLESFDGGFTGSKKKEGILEMEKPRRAGGWSDNPPIASRDWPFRHCPGTTVVLPVIKVINS